jgi:hypothetical protein
MQTSLMAYLLFGVAGAVSGIWMLLEVNRAKVVPYISFWKGMWKRDLPVIQIYRLHKEHFPGSPLRIVQVMCTCFCFFFFAVFIYEAEMSRPDSNAIQPALYEQRSR